MVSPRKKAKTDDAFLAGSARLANLMDVYRIVSSESMVCN